MDQINKCQLNVCIDTDANNKITKRSLLINIRADEPAEIQSLFLDLKSKLSSSVTGFSSDEITYTGFPFEVSQPKKLDSAPVCPRCGKELRHRTGAKGPFMACSGFSSTGCKYTQAI